MNRWFNDGSRIWPKTAWSLMMLGPGTLFVALMNWICVCWAKQFWILVPSPYARRLSGPFLLKHNVLALWFIFMSSIEFSHYVAPTLRHYRPLEAMLISKIPGENMTQYQAEAMATINKIYMSVLSESDVPELMPSLWLAFKLLVTSNFELLLQIFWTKLINQPTKLLILLQHWRI